MSIEFGAKREVHEHLLYSPGVFNEPQSYGGKIIGVATELVTIDQFCEVLNKVLAPRVFKVGRKFYNLTTKNCRLIGNLHYRLICNLLRTYETFYHSSKEHLKISKIAKFRCEML